MPTVVSNTGIAIFPLWLDDHEADDEKSHNDDSENGEDFSEETPASVLSLPVPLPLLITTNHHHQHHQRKKYAQIQNTSKRTNRIKLGVS